MELGMTDQNKTTVPSYRVCWRVGGEGDVQYGKPVSTREVAEAWALYGNREYPDLHHWVEEIQNG
jgi:hypothetical protein